MVTAFRELFAYRVLIQILVARDLKARYRGSLLGFLWTTLNPLLLMATYALVFSIYIRIEQEGYAAFLACGLLPWIWFSSSLLMGATCIVDGRDLIKKVFLPAQVLPTVIVIANFINFLLSLPILFVFLLLFGIKIGWALSALPLIMALQFAFTLGLTLIVSAVTVRYRDLIHLLGNLLTFWFFLSPIIYPAAQVPERFRFVLSINPMAAFVIAYQDSLFYNRSLAWGTLGKATCMAAVTLFVGVLVFDRFKWSFAEEV